MERRLEEKDQVKIVSIHPMTSRQIIRQLRQTIEQEKISKKLLEDSKSERIFEMERQLNSISSRREIFEEESKQRLAATRQELDATNKVEFDID